MYASTLWEFLRQADGTHVDSGGALVDDIFIWMHYEERLLHYIDDIIAFHRTLNFTPECSHHKAELLDVTVCKENYSLITDLFVKLCHPLTLQDRHSLKPSNE